MENVTLGELLWLIGAIGIISGTFWKLHKIIRNAEKEREATHESIKELKEMIENMHKSLDEKIVDSIFETKKRSVINYMCLAELGEIAEDQKKNAHEDYDWYIEHGGNSYVKHHFEKLEEEGKI